MFTFGMALKIVDQMERVQRRTSRIIRSLWGMMKEPGFLQKADVRRIRAYDKKEGNSFPCPLYIREGITSLKLYHQGDWSAGDYLVLESLTTLHFRNIRQILVGMETRIVTLIHGRGECCWFAGILSSFIFLDFSVSAWVAIFVRTGEKPKKHNAKGQAREVHVD